MTRIVTVRSFIVKGAQFLVQWKVQMKGVLFLSVNGIYKSMLGWTSGRGFPNETLLSSPLFGGGGLPFFLSRGAAGPILHHFFLTLRCSASHLKRSGFKGFGHCLDSKGSNPQERMTKLIPIQSQ